MFRCTGRVAAHGMYLRLYLSLRLFIEEREGREEGRGFLWKREKGGREWIFIEEREGREGVWIFIEERERREGGCE